MTICMACSCDCTGEGLSYVLNGKTLSTLCIPCVAAGAVWAAKQAKQERAAASGEIKLLPNGMKYKPAEISTQAKYFYRFDVASDGQTASETVGFQTHDELIRYIAVKETDFDKQNLLYGLVTAGEYADAPVVHKASE